MSGADTAPLLRQTGSPGCARLRGSEVPSWKSKSHRLDSFPPRKAATTTKWPWKRLEQHDDPSDGCSLDDWFQSVYWLFMGCQVHQVQQVHHVQQMHEVLQVNHVHQVDQVLFKQEMDPKQINRLPLPLPSSVKVRVQRLKSTLSTPPTSITGCICLHGKSG